MAVARPIKLMKDLVTLLADHLLKFFPEVIEKGLVHLFDDIILIQNQYRIRQVIEYFLETAALIG